MRPTDVAEADVYKGSERVGLLTRTSDGAEFRYDEAFAAERKGIGVALSLPPSRRRARVRGVNLHPFFAGLLPEGLRLSALVQNTKTSSDDLLSLLIAVGGECIGDVAVVPKGEPLPRYEPTLDLARPQELDFQEILKASTEHPERDMSLPGVQEKISAGMISLPITARRAQASYILKLNPDHRPLLVENEHFFLRMAKGCGLDVAESSLLHDRAGRAGLLVTRFDRVFTPDTSMPRKLHQEDGCQLLERYPADKYRITCQEIVDALRDVTGTPIVQTLRFLELQAFNYLIGNGDFHAKNVSVFVSPRTGLLELTPAYDLLSTQAYRGLDQRMPMKLGAKDDRLKAEDFVEFGARNGVREPAIRKMLSRLTSKATPWLDHLAEVGFAAKDRDRVARAIVTRIGHLS